MKTIFFVTVLGLFLISCNQSNDISASVSDSTTTETSPLDKGVNASQPFGCEALAGFAYPKYWEADEKNYGHLKQPQGKEFDSLRQCFERLNAARPISKPKIASVEYVSINGATEKYYYYDTLAARSMDSCLYRLPDINGYQCYYFYKDSHAAMYGVYGNLLLLNPITHHGKLLNVYFEYGGDQHIDLRYFLVKDNAIHIYNGSTYDDGSRLEKGPVFIYKLGE